MKTTLAIFGMCKLFRANRDAGVAKGFGILIVNDGYVVSRGTAALCLGGDVSKRR